MATASSSNPAGSFLTLTPLDPRLLRSLADLKFSKPTPIQAEAIPLALEHGRDILARAQTGSGKTGAYCIPAVEKCLKEKEALPLTSAKRQSTRSLILVPTRELSTQVTTHIKSLLTYITPILSVCNVASGATTGLERLLLSDRPDIVVATPARALALLQSKALDLSELGNLVIDEADLILSYGHSESIQQIFSSGNGWLPKVFQSFLASATLTKDVEILKGMVLRNPAVLHLTPAPLSQSLLTQFSSHCTETDKFLLVYVLLKLRLIKGKIILFVNSVDRCYKLKLFLEQFGIKTCILNGELPLNSRLHVVEEFNKGVFDIVIASDEAGGEFDEDDDEEQEEVDEAGKVEIIDESDNFLPTQPAAAPTASAEEDEEEDEEEEEDIAAKEDGAEEIPKASSSKKRAASPEASTSKPSKKSKRSSGPKQDKYFGVSRGIDFISVSCVLNFDLPTTLSSYIHRIGRTARAGQSGLAISFVVPRAEHGKDKSVTLDTSKRDDIVFAKIKDHFGGDIKEWEWGGRRSEVEGFRYRMEDGLRSVTRKAVKEARREEVRRELINSEKLKSHFAINPQDLAYLSHDAPLHPTRVQSHLKHVPSYLMPRISAVPGSTPSAVESAVGGGELHVPFGKPNARGGRGGRGRGGRGGRGGSRGGRGGKKDPLKTFK